MNLKDHVRPKKLCFNCNGANLRVYVDWLCWMYTCKDCGYQGVLTKQEASEA